MLYVIYNMPHGINEEYYFGDFKIENFIKSVCPFSHWQSLINDAFNVIIRTFTEANRMKAVF